MVKLCLYILVYTIFTKNVNANIIGGKLSGAREVKDLSREQIRSREQQHRSPPEDHRSVNARTTFLQLLDHLQTTVPLKHLAGRELACPLAFTDLPLNISHLQVEWFLNENHGPNRSGRRPPPSLNEQPTPYFVFTYSPALDSSANETLILDLWQFEQTDLSDSVLNKGHLNAILKSGDDPSLNLSVRALIFKSPQSISYESHCSSTFYINSRGVGPTLPARVISNRTQHIILAPSDDRKNSTALELCVRPATGLLSCTIPQDLLKNRESSNAYHITPAHHYSKRSPPQVLAWILTQETPSLGTTPKPETILAWVPLNQEPPLSLTLPHARVKHFVTRDAYLISIDEPLQGYVSCAILSLPLPPPINNTDPTIYALISPKISALSRTLSLDANGEFDSDYNCKLAKVHQVPALNKTQIVEFSLYLPDSAPLFGSGNGVKSTEINSVRTRFALRTNDLGRIPMLVFDRKSEINIGPGPNLLLDSWQGLDLGPGEKGGSFNLWFRANNIKPSLAVSNGEPSLFADLDVRSMVQLYYDTLLGGHGNVQGNSLQKTTFNNVSAEIAEQAYTLIPDHFYDSKLPPCTLALNAFLLFASDKELSAHRTHPALKESYYDNVPLAPTGDATVPAAERQFICLKFAMNTSSQSRNPIQFVGAVRYTVKFESPARFLNVPDSRVVKRGSTVRFKCSGLGLPPPRITWLKDGLPLSPSGKISIVTPWSVKANHHRPPAPPLRSRRPPLVPVPKKPEISVAVPKVETTKNESYVADLVISNVQEGDTGAYQCLLNSIITQVTKPESAGMNYRLVSRPAYLSLVVLEHEPTAPIAVRGLPLDSTSALITWEDPANTGSGNLNLLAYSVHYTGIAKINGTPGQRPSKTSESQVIVDPGKRRIVLKRLEPGTLYEIYLVAYNAYSASPNSNPIKLAMPFASTSSETHLSRKNYPVKSIVLSEEIGTRPVNDMPFMSSEKSPLQKMPTVLGGKGPNASTWLSYKGEMSWFEKIGDPSLTFDYSNGTQTLSVFYHNSIVSGNESAPSNGWSSYASGDWTLVYFPIFAQNKPSDPISQSDIEMPLFLSSLEIRPPRISSQKPVNTKDFVTLTGLLPGTLYAFRLIKNASELREIRAHINSYLSSTALHTPKPFKNDTTPITSTLYNDNLKVSNRPNLTNNFNNFAESIRRGWSFYLLPLAKDSLELGKGMRGDKLIMDNNASGSNVRRYTKVIESWLLATILIAVSVIILVTLATICICRRRAAEPPAVSLKKHYYTGIATNDMNGHINNKSIYSMETPLEETQPSECLPLQSPPETDSNFVTRANTSKAYV